jgi:hypothetical protein
MVKVPSGLMVTVTSPKMASPGRSIVTPLASKLALNVTDGGSKAPKINPPASNVKTPVPSGLNSIVASIAPVDPKVVFVQLPD